MTREAAHGVGARLRQLRHVRGLTLRATATAVGLHFTYLSKVENGHEPPGEATIRALATVVGGDVEELLALAGKLPARLQQRAAQDAQFAMLLRRLPDTPDSTLEQLYALVCDGDVTREAAR
jgi:transcriptional regulator with XRE-family HTH domain